jgi:hypothetical protein
MEVSYNFFQEEFSKIIALEEIVKLLQIETTGPPAPPAIPQVGVATSALHFSRGWGCFSGRRLWGKNPREILYLFVFFSQEYQGKSLFRGVFSRILGEIHEDL